MDAGYEVHLANPSGIQQYSGLKYTDDKWDSFWLAHMLRLGILPEGYIYEVIDFLSERIGRIEKAVIKQVKRRYPFEKLLTVPGIGNILGITIMLETGDINRFPTVSDYSSYCRCVSSKKVSNGKKKGENNKKNGNKYLAWAYVEAANFMKRFCPEAMSWHQRKAAKTNNIVATKALSNKIARACYYIIKEQVSFEPKRLFA